MPSREKFQKNKAEADLMAQNVQLKQSELEQLEQALAQLNQSKNDNILKALPKGPQQDTLILELSDLAKKSGFAVNAMNFTLSDTSEKEKSLTIAANLSGPVGSLVRFLQSIERASRFMEIQSLNLQLTSAETMTFNISLTAYYQ